MNLPRYLLIAAENLTTFEFTSEGSKGQISKLVQYTQTNVKDVFNIFFGDKDKSTGQIDDTITSNNGDSEKVLTTIAATMYVFTKKYPDAYIYATGSTKARTRLYRMAISKYIFEINMDFEIYGELPDCWEIFRKGVEYEGFLIKRKNH